MTKNIPGSQLSQKELKVLTALTMKFSYKEIAEDFRISINTVKKHVKNIYRKLQVSKRAEAIQKFLVPTEEPVNN